ADPGTRSTSRAQGPFRNTGAGERCCRSVSCLHNGTLRGLRQMAGKRVWFITGAGRGMGVDIAQAALVAGNPVVATGRNAAAVANAVGQSDDLLVVELDITSPASAREAVRAASERFGRIDV